MLGERGLRQGGEGGDELALVYLSVASVLLTLGPGKLSLDAIVFREKGS